MALTPEQIKAIRGAAGVGETPQTGASEVSLIDQLGISPQGTGLRGATKAVGDFAVGAAKGLGSTLQNVASPITNALPEMKNVKTGEVMQKGFSKEELAPTSPAQEAGKVTEQIGEFFVPGVAGAKAAKGANFLTKMAVEGLSSAGVNAAQTGTAEGAIEGGIAGAVSPVIGKTLSFIGKGVAKNAAGAIAKGTNILDSVLDNPRAALEGLNMPSEQVFSKDIGLIKDAVTNTYKQAKNAYGSGILKLDEVIPQINKNTTRPAIDSALDKFGIKLRGNVNNGFIVDTTESALSDQEKNVVQKVIDLVSKSDANTPSQVDALAQKIGKFEKNSEDARQVNSIVRGIKNAIRGTIVESAPEEYKDVAQNIVSDYAKSMDKLSLYQQLFKVSKDTLLSETEKAAATNKLKNLFSGEKPVEEKVLRELGLEDILSRQAGRVSTEDISRSQVGLGDLLKTAVNTVVTPKNITKIAAYTKLTSDAISDLVGKSKTVEEFISSLPRMAQGYVLQQLHDSEE